MNLETLSPAKLEAAYAKASNAQGAIGDQLINAGRGHETGRETRTKAKDGDALAIKWVDATDKFAAVVDEMDRRKRYHGSLKRTPNPKF